MEYQLLQKTDLKVSGLCLGCVEYGSGMSWEESKRQLELFYSHGGNFLDTAHIYADWKAPERAASEKTIGRWMKQTGKRHDIVISTKGAHPHLETMELSRVLPDCIRLDLEESLKALETDYIDLYFLHRDNEALPVEEILGTLEEARGQGKIRWYGCSNWKLSRIQEADRLAADGNFPGFVCNQLMWSLAVVNREAIHDKTLVMMDEDTFAYHMKTGKSAMAYTSIAHGYLSKRQDGVKMFPGLRNEYDNESNEEILKLLAQYGIPAEEAAFAYFAGQPFNAVPIASFRTEKQLIGGVRSIGRALPTELFHAVQSIKKLKNF